MNSMTTAQRAVERLTPPPAPFDLVNKMVRWMLSGRRRSTRIGRHLLLLHVTGRRTGRTFDVPVAYRPAGDGRLLVLTNSPWRVNLRDTTAVEVTLKGRRQLASAELVEDPSTVAAVYRDLISQVGRRRATRELGVRINVDRDPTLDELTEAAAVDRLCVVYLTLSYRS